MKKILSFLLFALSVAAATAAFAQDAALIQAARKEAKVVWYTSLALPSSTALAHFFQNKYKGIEVEVHRNGLPARLAAGHAGSDGGNQKCGFDSYLRCGPFCVA